MILNGKSFGEDIEKILESADKSLGEKPEEESLTIGGLAPEGEAVFEFVSGEEPEENKHEAPVGVKKTEESVVSLDVPDVFSVAEESEYSALHEATSKIRTTYVPRFTEVSDNYRMKNDPRPRREKETPALSRADVTVRVASHKKAAPKQSSVIIEDPTEELESAKVDAVVVDVSGGDSVNEGDRLNVYKFSDKTEQSEEPAPRTVEDERREIEKIISRPISDTEEMADEPIPEEAEVTEEKREFSIPDPDPEDMVVISDEEERAADETAPDCISTAPDNKRSAYSEFNLPIQRDGFKDKFLDGLISVKVRLVASAMFALLLLSFEILVATSVFGSEIFGIPVKPIAPLVLDYLLAVSAFLIALPEVALSVKLLFKKKLMPEIILPVSLIILTVYTATVSLGGGLFDYPLFGFMLSITAFSVVLATYFRRDGNFLAFKLISKNGEKRIFDKKPTRELPEENLALDGAVDEYKSVSARLYRASFITDFFSNTKRISEGGLRRALIIAIPLGAALVSAFVCFFLAGGVFSAVSALTFAVFLGIPTFAILSHKLPYHDAQLAARCEMSAAVGESALSDFSEVDVIAFDDTEIFGEDDVNLKRFMLYGDSENMEKTMRRMCSLFSVVGGPLLSMFSRSLDSGTTHSPAHSPEIEADGLSGEVGGVRIYAGSEDYMRRHGIAVPELKRSEAGLDTIRVMYAAEEGELLAKFYVRYSFSEEFTMLLPQLREEGIVPLIYTRDPNVSTELMRTLTSGSDSIRIVKKLTPVTEAKVYSRVSGELVTFGDKINAINVILLSKKYKKLSERLRMSEMYAMGAGTVLAVALSLLGMTGVPALVFGVWQIGWCLVLRFVSRNAFLKDKTREELRFDVDELL